MAEGSRELFLGKDHRPVRGMDAGGNAGLGNGHEIQLGSLHSSVFKVAHDLLVCQYTGFRDALYTQMIKLKVKSFYYSQRHWMPRTLPQIRRRWNKGRRPRSRAQRASQQGQGRSSQSAREQHQLYNIARQIETLEAQSPQPLSCRRMPRSLPQMRRRWSRGRRPRSSAQRTSGATPRHFKRRVCIRYHRLRRYSKMQSTRLKGGGIQIGYTACRTRTWLNDVREDLKLKRVKR